MKLLHVFALFFALASACGATTITFGPSEVDLGQGAGSGLYGTPTNEWGSFEILIEGAFLYNDARDTFDRIGLTQSDRIGRGVIRFVKPVDKLGFDYVIVSSIIARYAVFDANDLLLGEILPDTTGAPVNGSHTFESNGIAYLTFSGERGEVSVSTLRFGEDTGNIPEPSTFALAAAGIAVVAFRARRR